jgi:hypothetical protein
MSTVYTLVLGSAMHRSTHKNGNGLPQSSSCNCCKLGPSNAAAFQQQLVVKTLLTLLPLQTLP